MTLYINPQPILVGRHTTPVKCHHVRSLILTLAIVNTPVMRRTLWISFVLQREPSELSSTCCILSKLSRMNYMIISIVSKNLITSGVLQPVTDTYIKVNTRRTKYELLWFVLQIGIILR